MKCTLPCHRFLQLYLLAISNQCGKQTIYLRERSLFLNSVNYGIEARVEAYLEAHLYQFISFNSTQTPPIRKAESLLHDGYLNCCADVRELNRITDESPLCKHHHSRRAQPKWSETYRATSRRHPRRSSSVTSQDAFDHSHPLEKSSRHPSFDSPFLASFPSLLFRGMVWMKNLRPPRIRVPKN